MLELQEKGMVNMKNEIAYHNIEPVYDKDSNILILGSFPSVKSREMEFFYGHPQNRFWKVLAGIYEVEVPKTIEEKKSVLLAHHIAVWDVIASCTITGSSDSSIKDVIPNDIDVLLKNSGIKKIYANGGTAYKLYEKYIRPKTDISAVKLPSTSPANAAFRLERLIDAWRIINE